jgi:hypothetical protein
MNFGSFKHLQEFFRKLRKWWDFFSPWKTPARVADQLGRVAWLCADW